MQKIRYVGSSKGKCNAAFICSSMAYPCTKVCTQQIRMAHYGVCARGAARHNEMRIIKIEKHKYTSKMHSAMAVNNNNNNNSPSRTLDPHSRTDHHCPCTRYERRRRALLVFAFSVRCQQTNERKYFRCRRLFFFFSFLVWTISLRTSRPRRRHSTKSHREKSSMRTWQWQ